jgi:hypothetical protein
MEIRHSRSAYAAGCKCDKADAHCGRHCKECKAITAKYVTDNRHRQAAKKAAMGKLSAVPDLPVSRETRPAEGGALRRAALAQVAGIPGAEESDPLTVASILFLADQCDRGDQPQQNAQAIKEMKLLLEQLRPKGAALKSVGKSQQEMIYEMFGAAL